MIGFLTDGWTDQAVSAANGFLAWIAFLAHIYAASKTSMWLRKMFMGIGALALFYSCAYWWLFFNPERVVEWSNFLRPFGVLTWIIAWAVEPLVLLIYLQRSGASIRQRAEDAAEEPRKRLDEFDERAERHGSD